MQARIVKFILIAGPVVATAAPLKFCRAIADLLF